MSHASQNAEKEFLDTFRELTHTRSAWQAWADVMSVIACSISNAVDKEPERNEAREREYEECIKRLGSVELPAKLMAIIAEALSTNPEQDFLGAMYMKLELGSHWKGQFFTPYNVCQCMAEITMGETTENNKGKDYLSVNDPACGAGATLIAAANTLRKRGVNYQTDTLFVGQDIDRVVGLMCYIQLSLLGCPGYVVIADALTNPVCGSVITPAEKPDQEFWYTPFYFTDIWMARRLKESLRALSHISELETNDERDEKEVLE